MRFYKVVAKCGHVGLRQYYEGVFYVKAENGSTAADIHSETRLETERNRCADRLAKLNAVRRIWRKMNKYGYHDYDIGA